MLIDFNRKERKEKTRKVALRLCDSLRYLAFFEVYKRLNNVLNVQECDATKVK